MQGIIIVCGSLLLWNAHPSGLFIAILSWKLHSFWVYAPYKIGLWLLETNPGILDSGSLNLVHEPEAPGDSKRFLG